ncbi:MAG: hypothetical protein JW765_05225 [Deltaproteobacteria bacterium]|nr:hypothetical protein [Candidatus Zymogenaceae bacterium]
MSVRELCNEIVTLQKKSGEKMEGMKVHVQPTLILSFDVDYPVEEGDLILRKLPNGLTEEYVVIDRGFWDRDPPGRHYQMKVMKKGTLEYERRSPIPNITIKGDQSRVLIHSQDNSVNYALTKDNVFQIMRDEITKSVSNPSDLEQIIAKLDELEKAKGADSFKDRYLEFIAVAANHITIVAPFLPVLLQFFGAMP